MSLGEEIREARAVEAPELASGRFAWFCFSSSGRFYLAISLSRSLSLSLSPLLSLSLSYSLSLSLSLSPSSLSLSLSGAQENERITTCVWTRGAHTKGLPTNCQGDAVLRTLFNGTIDWHVYTIAAREQIKDAPGMKGKEVVEEEEEHESRHRGKGLGEPRQPASSSLPPASSWALLPEWPRE